ncbi:PGPGW domain-containing protein [Desulfobacterota bacterium M19]
MFAHKYLLWLAAFSVLTFIGSLLIIPILLVRIPVDYFVAETGRSPRISLLILLSRVLKNISGLVLLGAGILMLFLPGQGLLTIVIALSLLDFPGKRALELRLIRQPRVYKAINWLRRKYKRPPLIIP